MPMGGRMRRARLLPALFLVVLCLVGSPASASGASSSISGVISTDTTWSVSGSPYLLTGNVGVDTGATLTIDPGVVVKAQGNYTLQVAGKLVVQGSQDQPVSFTCTSQVKGCWGGIQFTSAQSGSVLDHADIAYASTGLSTEDKTWTLTSSRVHDNTTGIDASGGANGVAPVPVGTVNHSLIDHNQTGVNVFYSLLQFDSNTVTSNQTGLRLLGRGDQLHNNNILGNSTWNAYACFFSGSSYVVDASSNWWGTTDTAAIGASICDHADNLNQPTITTSPIASSIVTSAPQLLSVTVAGSGTGTITSQPSGLNCSSSCSALFDTSSTVTLTAAADVGSVFTGWSGGGCTGTDTCQVTLDAMTTVTATFVPVYPLSVTPAGSGTGSVTSQPTGVDCGVTCSTSYASGTSVTLTATADPGSRFGGWSGEGCTGTGTCQVTMTAARSVTATFVAVYQLSVAADGSGSGIVTSQPGGINCGATCSAMFDAGTTVTLTASPAAGSRFSGWSGDCSGTGACQVTIGAAASVTATFTRTYALSVSRAGSGAGQRRQRPAWDRLWPNLHSQLRYRHDRHPRLRLLPPTRSLPAGQGQAAPVPVSAR